VLAAESAGVLDELAAEIDRLRPRHSVTVPLVSLPAVLGAKGIRKLKRTYRVDTSVQGHRVVQGGFKTSAKAEEWLYRIRTDQRFLEQFLKHRIAPKTNTIMLVLDHYMKHRGEKVRSACKHRGYMARLVPMFGHRGADSIRQRDVDDYYELRQSEGVGKKTIYNELSFLRTALRYGWRNDKVNYLPKFVLSCPRCARTRVVREDEMQMLIAAADISMRRVLIAAWTMGLRRNEIVMARWDWCNAKTREITIPSAVAKTEQERVAVFPPLLWAALQDPPRHDEAVFCRIRHGRNGQSQPDIAPWVYSMLGKKWAKLRASVGLEDVRLHDLRRSMATVAQERGHTQSAVQLVGGWEDPNVLQRHYSHAGRAAQQAVVEDLERLILSGDP
jgi:integrase